MKGAVPVIQGRAVVDKDTIDMKEIGAQYGVWWAPEGIFTYYCVGLETPKDSLFAVLSFAKDHLIEVAFFARGHYYLNSLLYETDRMLGASGRRTIATAPDSTVRYPDRIVEYGEKPTHRHVDGVKNGTRIIYEEDCRTAVAHLTLFDTKAHGLMPGWCGNDDRNVSWEKFIAFVESKRKQ